MAYWTNLYKTTVFFFLFFFNISSKFTNVRVGLILLFVKKVIIYLDLSYYQNLQNRTEGAFTRTGHIKNSTHCAVIFMWKISLFFKQSFFRYTTQFCKPPFFLASYSFWSASSILINSLNKLVLMGMIVMMVIVMANAFYGFYIILTLSKREWCCL